MKTAALNASKGTAEATAFWDRIYDAGAITVPSPNPAVAAASLRHFGDIQGKTILDIGFGRGEFTALFASLGARVVAIETSLTAVHRLQQFCRQERLDNVTVLRRSAFELDGEPFDFVFGSMVLHHLEPFEAFAAALYRCTRNGSSAFFYENNGSSRIALWFRQHLAGRLWFPKYGDRDEFPLTPAEVDRLRPYFEVTVEYPEFRYFGMFSLYVLRNRVAPQLFAWLDRQCFRIPGLRKFSYVQYLRLRRL